MLLLVVDVVDVAVVIGVVVVVVAAVVVVVIFGIVIDTAVALFLLAPSKFDKTDMPLY